MRGVRRAGWLSLAATLAIAVPGCGGGGGSQTATPAAPALPAETATAPAPALPKQAALPKSFNAGTIYRRVSPGVVTVVSIFGAGRNAQAGQGSGFVLNKDGEVVTNAHVVTTGEGGSIKRAGQVYVQFSDRNRVRGRIVGYDPFADVALLRVAPKGLHLVPLALADGKGITVGQPVAAIGSPFGETGSLSIGVISGRNRSVQSLTSFEINDAIQTDAAINHGNSGGPLLDAKGRVIGINQQIESTSGGGEGVGFAVPVTAVHRSLEQLRREGRAAYAYIGVSSQQLYPQLARRLRLPTAGGVLVADVVKNGPGARAGIRGGRRRIRFQGSAVKVGGDVILTVDGKRILLADDLSRIIGAHKPGDTVRVGLLRNGHRQDVQVKLGVRPTSLRR